MALPKVLLSTVLVLSVAACNSSKSETGSSGAGLAPTGIQTSTPFTQVDLLLGTGAAAGPGNRVTVAYSGWLFDPSQPESKGRQFDQSNAFTFTLGVGQVIKGWDQGVVGMRVGGQRRLTIPSDLAYGNQAVGTIPANSSLVFDIRLISIG